MMRPPMLTLALGTLILASGCADRDDDLERSPAIEEAELPETERVHRSSTVLLTSQPGAAGLRAAHELHGVATVVNLRLPEEVGDEDERELVESLGMEYVSIPFGEPRTLTDDVFERVRAILRDPAKRPLLLHCSSGNRVGAVWYAYRRLDQGTSHARAMYEAEEIGLKKPGHIERAIDYVAPHRAD